MAYKKNNGIASIDWAQFSQGRTLSSAELNFKFETTQQTLNDIISPSTTTGYFINFTANSSADVFRVCSISLDSIIDVNQSDVLELIHEFSFSISDITNRTIMDFVTIFKSKQATTITFDTTYTIGITGGLTESRSYSVIPTGIFSLPKLYFIRKDPNTFDIYIGKTSGNAFHFKAHTGTFGRITNISFYDAAINSNYVSLANIGNPTAEVIQNFGIDQGGGDFADNALRNKPVISPSGMTTLFRNVEAIPTIIEVQELLKDYVVISDLPQDVFNIINTDIKAGTGVSVVADITNKTLTINATNAPRDPLKEFTGGQGLVTDFAISREIKDRSGNQVLLGSDGTDAFVAVGDAAFTRVTQIAKDSVAIIDKTSNSQGVKFTNLNLIYTDPQGVNTQKTWVDVLAAGAAIDPLKIFTKGSETSTTTLRELRQDLTDPFGNHITMQVSKVGQGPTYLIAASSAGDISLNNGEFEIKSHIGPPIITMNTTAIKYVGSGGVTYTKNWQQLLTNQPPTQLQIYELDKTIWQAGTNITLDKNDVTNIITINSSGGGTTFTPTQANIYPVVKPVITATSEFELTKDDTTNTINIASDALKQTIAKRVQSDTSGTITTLPQLNSSSNPIATMDAIPAALTQSNLYSGIATMLKQGTNVNIDFNATTNEITISSTGGSGSAPTQEQVYNLNKLIFQVPTDAPTKFVLDDAAHTITTDSVISNQYGASWATVYNWVWNGGTPRKDKMFVSNPKGSDPLGFGRYERTLNTNQVELSFFNGKNFELWVIGPNGSPATQTMVVDLTALLKNFPNSAGWSDIYAWANNHLGYLFVATPNGTQPQCLGQVIQKKADNSIVLHFIGGDEFQEITLASSSGNPATKGPMRTVSNSQKNHYPVSKQILVAGTGVTLTGDDVANTITVAATGGTAGDPTKEFTSGTTTATNQTRILSSPDGKVSATISVDNDATGVDKDFIEIASTNANAGATKINAGSINIKHNVDVESVSFDTHQVSYVNTSGNANSKTWIDIVTSGGAGDPLKEFTNGEDDATSKSRIVESTNKVGVITTTVSDNDPLSTQISIAHTGTGVNVLGPKDITMTTGEISGEVLIVGRDKVSYTDALGSVTENTWLEILKAGGGETYQFTAQDTQSTVFEKINIGDFVRFTRDNGAISYFQEPLQGFCVEKDTTTATFMIRTENDNYDEVKAVITNGASGQVDANLFNNKIGPIPIEDGSEFMAQIDVVKKYIDSKGSGDGSPWILFTGAQYLQQINDDLDQAQRVFAIPIDMSGVKKFISVGYEVQAQLMDNGAAVGDINRTSSSWKTTFNAYIDATDSSHLTDRVKAEYSGNGSLSVKTWYFIDRVTDPAQWTFNVYIALSNHTTDHFDWFEFFGGVGAPNTIALERSHIDIPVAPDDRRNYQAYTAPARFQINPDWTEFTDTPSINSNYQMLQAIENVLNNINRIKIKVDNTTTYQELDAYQSGSANNPILTLNGATGGTGSKPSWVVKNMNNYIPDDATDFGKLCRINIVLSSTRSGQVYYGQLGSRSFTGTCIENISKTELDISTLYISPSPTGDWKASDSLVFYKGEKFFVPAKPQRTNVHNCSAGNDFSFLQITYIEVWE